MRAGWWLAREGRAPARPHGEPPSWRRATGQGTSSWRTARKVFHFSVGGPGPPRPPRGGGVGLRTWPLACAKPLRQRASCPLHGPPMVREWNGQDAPIPSVPIPSAKHLPDAIPARSTSQTQSRWSRRSRQQALVPRSGLAPAQPPARRQLFLVSAPQSSKSGESLNADGHRDGRRRRSGRTTENRKGNEK